MIKQNPYDHTNSQFVLTQSKLNWDTGTHNVSDNNDTTNNNGEDERRDEGRGEQKGFVSVQQEERKMEHRGGYVCREESCNSILIEGQFR